MPRLRRFLRYAVIVAAAFGAGVFLLNTSLFTPRAVGEPVLLAHRGVAQRFHMEGIDNDTCTAERMIPSDHSYIENTVASMRASFDAGADIIELDVHPTTDGEMAVFHDWTLDCRTEGRGRTRDHAMADLRRLDVGHGYTADGGQTYPLRGRGVGMMPSLREVFAAFPDGRFVINVKGRDLAEADLLAAHIEELPPSRRAGLIVYGGGSELIDRVKESVPDIRIMSQRTLFACLQDYILVGWTGIMPDVCENTAMLVPINIAPWLWGWPDKFLARFEAAGTPVFVIGPWRGERHTTGIDTPEDLARLPDGYAGGIWTNEIELIGRSVRGGE